MPTTHHPERDQQQDEAERRHHMMDEADIGSGEKTPGEKETDEEIRKIPPLPSQQHGREQEQPSKP